MKIGTIIIISLIVFITMINISNINQIIRPYKESIKEFAEFKLKTKYDPLNTVRLDLYYTLFFLFILLLMVIFLW